MQYDYLMGMIKLHETKRIRAFNGRKQTNPERVPAAFALLMPQIITLMAHNLNDLCEFDQGIVVFGLQPACSMITSNKPVEQNRCINGLPLDYHFCCTLDYFIVNIDQLNQPNTWGHTKSIIIDFTSGEVMDPDRFLSKLQFAKSVFAGNQGILYGQLNEEALEIVWIITRIKQAQRIDAMEISSHKEVA